ncbi:ATP-binding protein [Nakamurella flavida]
MVVPETLGVDQGGSLVRVTAVLRLPLIALLSLLAGPVPDAQVERPWYLGTLGVYLLADLGWLALCRNPGNARWLPWVSTAVDVLALVALAASSGGPTSLVQPVFFMLPVAVSFHALPWLTSALGGATAVGYLAVWLARPGQDGGPNLPPVVFLHAGFLVWLAAATTWLSVVLLRRRRAVEQLLRVRRMLVAQTLQLEERERTDLAERLHDGPLQVLVAARMRLEEVRDESPWSGPTGGDPRRDPLTAVLTQLRTCAGQIRSVVTVLHPQVLGQLGLAAGLAELARDHTARTGQPVDTRIDDVGHPEVQALVYAAARELLANVARHAQASRVSMGLTREVDALVLRVADDGIGFDPQIIDERIAAGHIGLGSHMARVAAVGGSLRIRPDATSGTEVTVSVPAPEGTSPEGRPVRP